MRTKRIKKTMVPVSLLLALWFSFTTGEYAKKKRINIVTSLGVATFFFEDPIVDIGAEFELMKGFYARFTFTSTLGSGGYNPYQPYYYSGTGEVIGPDMGIYADTMLGINSIAVYKHRLFKRTHMFWQTGAFFLHYKEYEYEMEMDYYFHNSTSGFGALAGTGVEFILGRNLDVKLGASYQQLFNKDILDIDSGKSRNNWLKFYVGINYRIN